jgi:hypothetical protein
MLFPNEQLVLVRQFRTGVWVQAGGTVLPYICEQLRIKLPAFVAGPRRQILSTVHRRQLKIEYQTNYRYVDVH